MVKKFIRSNEKVQSQIEKKGPGSPGTFWSLGPVLSRHVPEPSRDFLGPSGDFPGRDSPTAITTSKDGSKYFYVKKCNTVYLLLFIYIFQILKKWTEFPKFCKSHRRTNSIRTFKKMFCKIQLFSKLKKWL